MLLLLGGDIERNPGPVPPPRVPRGPCDPRLGFTQSTSTQMEQLCFSAFKLWALENLSCDFEQLSQNAHGIALGLRGCQYLDESGHPRYMLVYAITAVQDKFPHYRGFLSRRGRLTRSGSRRSQASADPSFLLQSCERHWSSV